MNKYRMTLLSLLNLVFMVFTTLTLFAQENTDVVVDAGAPDTDPTMMYQIKAQQNIKEIPIRSFEDEGFWSGHFSRDNGTILTRTRISSGPQAKPKIPQLKEGNDASANQDFNILGVRINFKRRSIGEAFIVPRRPVPIEGTVKTVSVWVAGRNANHVLKLVVKELVGKGKRYELYMGNLNFLGWKKLTATIPPSLKQRDFQQSDLGTGLLIESFKIETSLEDSIGNFYVYFDDLRATTDLFGINAKDPDDPADNW